MSELAWLYRYEIQHGPLPCMDESGTTCNDITVIKRNTWWSMNNEIKPKIEKKKKRRWDRKQRLLPSNLHEAVYLLPSPWVLVLVLKDGDFDDDDWYEVDDDPNTHAHLSATCSLLLCPSHHLCVWAPPSRSTVTSRLSFRFPFLVPWTTNSSLYQCHSDSDGKKSLWSSYRKSCMF